MTCGCGDKVSFGEASNCQNFRRINKGERKDRCRKYNLCRKCLKSLKRVKHNIQDCPAPGCEVCKKNHHTLICPEEGHEQKLHKVLDEDGDSDNENYEKYYEDKDLFDPNLQFHFSHNSSGYDDGDDFQDYHQEEDDYGEGQDDSGNVPEIEGTDRTMFVKSQSIDQNHGKNAEGKISGVT